MRRPALLVLPVLLAALSTLGTLATLGGCATYRQDLERARSHYDKNEYEAALALFRVLEPDTDSLSTAEYAQYAYSRGMTDYRLAALANPGSALTDPKAAFRANARHWLSVARAVEKETPGGLNADEKQRLDEALVDLNKDVYGGGDAPAADTAVKAAAPAKTPAKDDASTGGK